MCRVGADELTTLLKGLAEHWLGNGDSNERDNHTPAELHDAPPRNAIERWSFNGMKLYSVSRMRKLVERRRVRAG
jgi:hypothetical protein